MLMRDARGSRVELMRMASGTCPCTEQTLIEWFAGRVTRGEMVGERRQHSMNAACTKHSKAEEEQDLQDPNVAMHVDSAVRVAEQECAPDSRPAPHTPGTSSGA